MMMKKSAVRTWALTLLMGTLLWTTGSAAPMQCHFNSRALCVYEGKHYSLGETWMENGCLQCTCLHPVGVGCCETVHRPVDFPSWCEVRVEMLTCKVSLVQTADPRLPCSPGEGNFLDPRQGGHFNFPPWGSGTGRSLVRPRETDGPPGTDRTE